jgi:hypothetical protein
MNNPELIALHKVRVQLEEGLHKAKIEYVK